MSAKEELIKYRREKAKETLQDAKILFDAKRLHSVLNCIYYAMFYGVVALLFTKDLSSAKHSGVRALFNEHYSRYCQVFSVTEKIRVNKRLGRINAIRSSHRA